MKYIALLMVSATGLGSLLALSVAGGDSLGRCSRCGCSQLVPVCRQVPVVTKVPKVEYSCECGHVCVPGRSICLGKECVTDCDGNCHHEKVYQPTCGKIFPTVKLVKKTTMIEKCSYKCVVEYVCDQCGCSCGRDIGPPAAPVIQNHEAPHPLNRQSN